MAKCKILIVDDDRKIVDLVRPYLERDNYRVFAARDGLAALELARQKNPDLIVLDILLPKVDGLDVCRILRTTSEVPIIMLTAKTTEDDKLVGLELGADDYMTKPFSPRELTLRVKAVLRRSGGTPQETRRLSHGALTLDLERHRCQVGGETIEPTAKEFGLLSTLMSRPGRVMSREQLLEEVWGADIAVTHRTIDTHLKRLREKLGEAGHLIDTVRGVGYRFSD